MHTVCLGRQQYWKSVNRLPRWRAIDRQFALAGTRVGYFVIYFELTA